MGKVSTKPQLDQNGQPSGMELVEITYGGLESPFGGIDSSAPPAYIDPRCFTQCDGFVVVDNKLCASSLLTVATPTLWNGVAGVLLLKFGTFYNSLTGQLNYALGYTATAFGTPGVTPTGVNYVFYITSWNPANVAVFTTDVKYLTLYDAQAVLSNASLTLGLVASQTLQFSQGTGATFAVTALGTNNALITAGISITAPGQNYNIGDLLDVY